MPLDIIERMDKQRGDIPRSRFLLRIIENSLTTTVIEKPQSPQVSRPMETEVNIGSRSTREDDPT
jgi:hypothetical protein